MDNRGYDLVTGFYKRNKAGQELKESDEQHRLKTRKRKSRLYFTGNTFDLLTGQDIQ